MSKAKLPSRRELTFSKLLHDEFSSTDWAAGKFYVSANRVHLLLVNDQVILAEVQGTAAKPYRVGIEFSNVHYSGEVMVACTCPRYADVENCKHLAATIVAADDTGVAELIPADKSLSLVPVVQKAIPDLFELFESEIQEFAASGPPRTGKSTAKLPEWQRQLNDLQRLTRLNPTEASPPAAKSKRTQPRQFIYMFDLALTAENGRPVILIYQRQRRKNGEWGTLKPVKLTTTEILELADEVDRPLVEMLFGNQLDDDYYGSLWSPHKRVSQIILAPSLFDVVLPRLCATGRCGIGESLVDSGYTVTGWLTWDDGPAWRFEVAWTQDNKAHEWRAAGSLVRGADETLERIAIQESQLILAEGLVLLKDRIARLEPVPIERLPWAALFRREPVLRVPEKDQDKFVDQLWRLPAAARPALPEPLKWETALGEPIPRVVISTPKQRYATPDRLGASVTFAYGPHVVKIKDSIEAFTDPATRRATERNRKREAERWLELREAGFSDPEYYLRTDFDLQIHSKRLSMAVMDLTQLGWNVEAEGLVIRRPGKISVSVTSGVDWFDLEAECDFGGIKAALPDLLAAVSKGQKFIELGDGSRGMLPEEWLAKYAPLIELGETAGDSLRFLPSQAMILDALLAAQPESEIDEKFAQVRNKLRDFAGIEPSHEPESFQGELREYQRTGLGWLNFLQEFGLGGCLADDMGLGKTVQVLALLEQRRVAQAIAKPNERKGANGKSSRSKKTPPVPSSPTLVVAPKSLVFNWLDEARRFTPGLRTLDYTGLARKGALADLGEIDLIVTTYGTMRRDIMTLREIEFHHVILDEAQAIKNAGSQSAKSSRLLKARHRLAMTGTPVENHLGDLWSLFEFLNPGMLGRSNNLRLFAGKSLPDSSSVELLAKAVRPFMLRRTKEQVLTELPAKTEQTLYCELEDEQRKLYNELRDHYRAVLAKKIETDGLGKAKIQVLEALLRLRQAACHPALIDKSKANIPSAKLETLLEQLDEVLSEGHKVLVFSQFTSLLALVRADLDRRGIVYEYLDGKSTHRKEKVARFQTDAACPIFLISLKAGGHGLNLTAADYVFILDPWWNPAVEAQAVDRAHRLGQEKPVFAYRLIARDTVEEKILELQGKKRDLADAVITADENLLRTLTAADLQLLLS